MAEEDDNREGMPPAPFESTMDESPWAPDADTFFASGEEPNTEVSVFDATAEDFDFGDVEVEGDPVSSEKALRIFSGRMQYSRSLNNVLNTAGSSLGDHALNSRFLVAELTRKMLAMIPENLWTEDFLKNVDIRPMLAAVSGSPYIQGDPAQSSEVRGVQMTAQERALASVFLSDEQQKVTEELEKGLVEAVQPGDVEAMEQAVVTARNIASEWRGSTTVGVRPVTPEGQVFRDTATGEFQATGGSTELDDFLADLNDFGGEGVTPTKFMHAKDVQLLFQSGELNLELLRDLETGGLMIDGDPRHTTARVVYEGEISRNDLRVQTAPDGRPLYTADAETQDEGLYRGKDWYSVREILRKPNEMSREQVMALHQKLKSSGLYELVGGEPQVPGDTTDSNFKAAWKLLASMSLERGQSMTSILAERTSAYQEELNTSLATNLTDPARLRIQGNAYGRDALGRHLSDEEHVELQKFIHEMERRNARTQAGLDITTGDSEGMEGVDALDEGIILDIDAQMQQWIRDNNPGEAGASDVASQYDSFTRMLGGPGRGGHFG